VSKAPNIAIGSIPHDDGAIQRLIEIYQRVLQEQEVNLTFYECNGLSHVAVAFLRGMKSAVGRNRRCQLNFVESSMLEHIYKHLESNGLLSTASPGDRVRNRDTIYCTRYSDRQSIKNDLEQIWLADDWLHADPAVKRALAGQVYELLDNALTHSGQNECFVCGHFYKKLQEMHLCIVDFGIGIPSRVRAHFLEQSVPADVIEKAPDTAFLRWALQKSNTTMKGQSRGLGLGRLEEFIRINKGVVDIYSLAARATICEERDLASLPHGFPGTLINIVYRTDGLYYALQESKE
jgi:hypothetical protein